MIFPSPHSMGYVEGGQVYFVRLGDEGNFSVYALDERDAVGEAVRKRYGRHSRIESIDMEGRDVTFAIPGLHYGFRKLSFTVRTRASYEAERGELAGVGTFLPAVGVVFFLFVLLVAICAIGIWGACAVVAR